MYICPICNQEFTTEEAVSKHLLRCWREEHPYHQPKSAPRSDDINIRNISDEIVNFFDSFQRR